MEAAIVVVEGALLAVEDELIAATGDGADAAGSAEKYQALAPIATSAMTPAITGQIFLCTD